MVDPFAASLSHLQKQLLKKIHIYILRAIWVFRQLRRSPSFNPRNRKQFIELDIIVYLIDISVIAFQNIFERFL